MNSSFDDIYSFSLPDYESNLFPNILHPSWLIDRSTPLYSSTHIKGSSKKRSNTLPRSQHKSHHHHHQSIRFHDSYDLRLIIVRHGERVDRCFGSNWTQLAFDHECQYHRFHENLPVNLPTRPNRLSWDEDTPLTRNGSKAARNLGRTLALKYIEPDYVYSSPAMRCMLTTIEMLKGLKLEKKVSIRIEPGLLEFGAARFGMNLFLKPIDWFNYGINVDLTYQPMMTTIAPDERVENYYLRSKTVVRQIEQRHSNPSWHSIHALIVAHATSPDTLTWDLIGKRPNTKDLYDRSLKVAYLQTMIAERKRKNQRWYLKHLN